MNIAICIGHTLGTGAAGNGLEEHEVSAAIAAPLVGFLREAGHVAEIIDFPHMDNDEELARVVREINVGNYDLAVSLHCDSSNNKNAHGAHVCHHKGSIYGKALATAIAEPLCQLLPGRAVQVQPRPDAAKKLKGLYFLSKTDMPAVLCECGFISNAEDAKTLANRPDAIARVIAYGICNFINNL